jgi:hypothetical protein
MDKASFYFLTRRRGAFYGIFYSKPGRSRRDNGNSSAKALEHYASINHNLVGMEDFRSAEISIHPAVFARA